MLILAMAKHIHVVLEECTHSWSIMLDDDIVPSPGYLLWKVFMYGNRKDIEIGGKTRNFPKKKNKNPEKYIANYVIKSLCLRCATHFAGHESPWHRVQMGYSRSQTGIDTWLQAGVSHK